MVKKVLFSLFVALIPVLTLSAQSQRFPHTESHDHSHDGRVFVGGSLNYWYNTDNQKSTFSFRPEAGYLFNDTWGAGAFFAYEFEDGQHGVGVTPFVRYYYLHRLPFNLYLDGCVGWNMTLTKDVLNRTTTTHGWEVGVRPGACIDLTEGLCLCLRLGFVGYRDNFGMGEEPGMGTKGFGVRFAPEELQIGLELEF
ncbi:hypothetical protein [uncultured Porphyromonas sp.]|uniref:hypothetical protein n=1 Tax=uncultured Porphyromonas sp. TaxID=159274 RepID=UPI0026094DB4|nr:hypothetical protein [uncultured Porphyromonas sp.]